MLRLIQQHQGSVLSHAELPQQRWGYLELVGSMAKLSLILLPQIYHCCPG